MKKRLYAEVREAPRSQRRRAGRWIEGLGKLSHYGARGEVRMVDVSEKAVTTRTAVAQGFVSMKRGVVRAVRRLRNPKGNPLEVARIAGIAAAKRTAEWIPLCHPLALTHIDVTARLCQNGVEVRSEVTATAQTGVEMEALVAVTAAALTVYDMCKALDKGMEISGIVLVEKTGGKSGDYFRGASVAGHHENNHKKTTRSRGR
jgi:cyclic pyranopterin phosphate synthase